MRSEQDLWSGPGPRMPRPADSKSVGLDFPHRVVDAGSRGCPLKRRKRRLVLAGLARQRRMGTPADLLSACERAARAATPYSPRCSRPCPTYSATPGARPERSPVAVELALAQHEEIADAIEARASARARRAMTTHIESGIWALGQLKDHAGSDNPPSVSETTSGSQSRRRERHTSARRPDRIAPNGK